MPLIFQKNDPCSHKSGSREGAIPFVQVQSALLDRECILGGTKEQFDSSAHWEMERMQKMDAYIAIRGSSNVFENSDLPPEDMKLAMKSMKAVLDWRVKKTKWCILRWPSPSMAQQAKMSSEAFERFFFDACCMDYGRMNEGMKALEKRMKEADQVKITGPGTNLSFSLKGISAVACGGTHNIPDGEVFSCPVKDSVEGTITFNADTIYQGTSFSDICLKFKNGKIIEATASSNEEKLNEILDSDEGARFIGEFAIAFNPMIREPMLDILFDEKICGSFHFTPVKLTKKQTMATNLRFTGIWSISNGKNGVEAKYFLIMNLFVRRDSLFPKIYVSLTRNIF